MISSVLSHLWPRGSAESPAASIPATSQSNVTRTPRFESHAIGPADAHLRNEMLRMYWIGVRRELLHVLLTLRRWNGSVAYSRVVLPDEQDYFIHGYDTFLDQVSNSSRGFAERYNKRRLPGKGFQKRATMKNNSMGILSDRGWDILAEKCSAEVKAAIREDLEGQAGLHLGTPDKDETEYTNEECIDQEEITRRRACLLLQGAQFLDIDRVIEYRQPERLVSFWKRPAVPQMKISGWDETDMPVLSPETCAFCRDILRGSFFADISSLTANTDKSSKEMRRVVCENCYRNKHYGDPAFTKMHKHCCFGGQISPTAARKICLCLSVPRIDKDGNPAQLFPVTDVPESEDGGQALHVNTAEGPSKVKCGLYQLPDMLAEAKYSTTSIGLDSRDTLQDIENEDIATQWLEKEKKAGRSTKGRPKKLSSSSKINLPTSVAEFGTSYGITDDSEESIPFYLRNITDKYPFGNVHMALRVGPLLIENGVTYTQGGALITFRDPPSLQVLHDNDKDIEHSLVLVGEAERTLLSQQRTRTPKRYKAMMKQIVGGAFTGAFTDMVNLEREIVDALIVESTEDLEDMPSVQRNTYLSRSIDRLMVKLQDYLSPRIEAYLDSVVARLLDPKTVLKWDFRTNNCQTFCDSLIDHKIFGSLLAPTCDSKSPTAADHLQDAPLPLYLMSFVCRPGAYVKANVQSKFDVPNGLTEEYLLKFRYGRHDECDVLDTLSEYWTDWGAFGKPLYPYQSLFPWDCTEAYSRYPTKCGDCNISKHVWAFPFDSWSLVSLHLARPRQFYPRDEEYGMKPTATKEPSGAKAGDHSAGGIMSDDSWFKNRLSVLLAQNTLLTAAAAMARTQSFHKATAWLTQQDDATLDRLKLGGIHRAQPFSHHFEKGAYHQFFVAEWTHLARPLQVKAYERLRDGRVRQVDVGILQKSGGDDDESRHDQYQYYRTPAFSCGGAAGRCAGGCSTGDASCGSQCVSTGWSDCRGGGRNGCGGHGGGYGGGFDGGGGYDGGGDHW